MSMKDKVILVTGANRGVGRALAAEALAGGAKRVYAGTRHPLADRDDRRASDRQRHPQRRDDVLGYPGLSGHDRVLRSRARRSSESLAARIGSVTTHACRNRAM